MVVRDGRGDGVDVLFLFSTEIPSRYDGAMLTATCIIERLPMPVPSAPSMLIRGSHSLSAVEAGPAHCHVRTDVRPCRSSCAGQPLCLCCP